MKVVAQPFFSCLFACFFAAKEKEPCSYDSRCLLTLEDLFIGVGSCVSYVNSSEVIYSVIYIFKITLLFNLYDYGLIQFNS